MNAEASEQLAARLGAAIRKRRKEAHLTLTQVARRADISVSHLSNIENGLAIASLSLLAKVASALEISLAELTRDEDELVVQTSRFPSEETGWRDLSHPALQTRVMGGVFDSGDSPDFPLSLSGQDLFFTVLRGRVILTLDGTDYELATGDAADARSVLTASFLVRESSEVLCSTTRAERH